MKPKVIISLDGAEADTITEDDKKKCKKLELERSFKVVFGSNSIVGAKQSKKPKLETWYFTVASTKDRDDWVPSSDAIK